MKESYSNTNISDAQKEAVLLRVLKIIPGNYGTGMDNETLLELSFEKARKWGWATFDPYYVDGDIQKLNQELQGQPLKGEIGMITGPVMVFADSRKDNDLLKKTLGMLAVKVSRFPFKTIIVPIGAGDNEYAALDHNILLVLQRPQEEWETFIFDQMGNAAYPRVKAKIQRSLPAIFKKNVFENNSPLSTNHNDCATVCSYLENEIHDGNHAMKILEEWIEDDILSQNGGFLNSADFARKDYATRTGRI
ncbi:MAG: hypothetical protein FWC51_01175 [Proteobacteria bacterium]|nr:hypothetical protein [Pseudomonadota bacterium]